MAAAAARLRAGGRVKRLRAVLAGSGSDAMTSKEINDAVWGLLPESKRSAKPKLAYLGTPTYDSKAAMERQCSALVERGAELSPVFVCSSGKLDAASEKAVKECDILVCSGGNPAFAMQAWRATGLDRGCWLGRAQSLLATVVLPLGRPGPTLLGLRSPLPHLSTPPPPELIRAAAERGAVLCGGSCGFIWLFDAGHSDSGDPDSFSEPAKERLGAEAVASKDWKYLRVPCLGFLPGLAGPHFDKVQSNGVLRATDFGEMMKRHPEERGIGVDHWAA